MPLLSLTLWAKNAYKWRMKTNAYDHSIRFLSKVHKNYTTMSKYLGLKIRGFRQLRNKESPSRSARIRIILGAKATYLRLLISELREMGALPDRALGKANRSIQDRLKQDQA